MPVGPLAAAFAYVVWGIFPIYFRSIAEVPAIEIVLHRSWWSMVLVFALLAATRRLAWLSGLPGGLRTVALTGLSALLLSGNWLLYVWAVNSDRVLDASLGYFVNPLVSVLLGTLVLHERLRAVQWAALAIAAGGVLWLTAAAGTFPWVALLLAVSFGLYGLLRKTSPLGSVEGLALETLLLAPLAGGAIGWLVWRGSSHFAAGDLGLDVLLVAAGPVTAVPLVLFAYGARRVRLATLGLLQYVTPSIQFVLGIFVYHEPFSPVRGIGFALIWTALAVYSVEGLWQMRRAPAVA